MALISTLSRGDTERRDRAGAGRPVGSMVRADRLPVLLVTVIAAGVAIALALSTRWIAEGGTSSATTVRSPSATLRALSAHAGAGPLSTAERVKAEQMAKTMVVPGGTATVQAVAAPVATVMETFFPGEQPIDISKMRNDIALVVRADGDVDGSGVHVLPGQPAGPDTNVVVAIFDFTTGHAISTDYLGIPPGVSDESFDLAKLGSPETL